MGWRNPDTGEMVRDPVTKLPDRSMPNENGHGYGCECEACTEEYRRLKRP